MHLAVVGILFGGIGSYILISTFAAPSISSVSYSESGEEIVLEYKKEDGDKITTDGLSDNHQSLFRLYGNGLVLCAPTSPESHEAIVSRQLNRDQMTELIKTITETGFTQLDAEYYKDVPIAQHQDVIRLVLKEKEYFTAFYNDMEKPAAYAEAETKITQFCESVKDPYEAEEVVLRVKPIKNAKSSVINGKWLKDKKIKINPTTKSEESLEISGNEAKDLQKQFGHSNRLTLDIDGSLFEAGLDKQSPKAKNEFLYKDYDVIRAEKARKATSLGDKIGSIFSNKAEAQTPPSLSMRHIILLGSDSPEINSASFGPLIKEQKDWYCSQLNKCYNQQNSTFDIVRSRLTQAQLQICQQSSGCSQEPMNTIIQNIYLEFIRNGDILKPNASTQILLGFGISAQTNFCGMAIIGNLKTTAGTPYSFGITRSDSTCNQFIANIMAHEFGHNLGMNHVDVPGSIMKSSTGCAITSSTGARQCYIYPTQAAEVSSTSPYFPKHWAPQALFAGQTLRKGQQIIAPDDSYRLVLGEDGNLFVWNVRENRAIWNAGTWNRGVEWLSMQPDGNLVLYDINGWPVWHTNTLSSANIDSRLIMHPTGNLIIYNSNNDVTWYRYFSSGNSGLMISNTPSVPSIGDKINVGQTLNAGNQLSSPNKKFKLIMQSNGNLVLYSLKTTIWSSNTSKPGSYLTLQPDGSLLIRAPDGSAPWYVGYGRGGTSFTLQDDGNAVLKNSAGTPVWSILTGSIWPSILYTNQTLNPGHVLQSPNRQYELRMQHDGNLVVWKGATPIWSSNTFRAGSYLILQPDGNLVVRAPDGSAPWYVGFGRGGTSLTMQDDGNIVLKNSAGTPVWSWITGYL